MNVKTIWTDSDGIEHLVRTFYDEIRKKFVTDYYVGSKENGGRIDVSGTIEGWVTSEDEYDAKRSHTQFLRKYFL